MDSILLDLRYGFRRLVRSPGFAFAALLTLALGIGANTTIFTIVNAALLRPPAQVSAPERLVSLYTSDYSGPAYGASSIPDYESFRTATDVFENAALFMQHSVGLGDTDVERLGIEIVSANYFQTLGVRPAHGRFFSADENAPGTNPVVVVSHALFNRRFGGDRSLVGSSIILNGRAVTVIGVAPEGFAGATRPTLQDAWIPLYAMEAIGADIRDLEERGSRGSMVVARLAQGVTIDAAQARMDVLARQMQAAYPDYWTDISERGRRITLVSERDARIPPQMRGPALGFIALLMGTVGLVLLVCCANVASLMLARSATRGREIGVRLSLGASRRRLIQQLLAESILISLAGGALGILVALWATDGLLALIPPLPVNIGIDLSVDRTVLLFTGVASILTGLLFGLAPALRVTRPDIAGVLRRENAALNLGGKRLTLQNILVVSQVAMSSILLIAAALFTRALTNASQIDPGFGVEGVLIAWPSPPPGTDGSLPTDGIMQELQARVAALPGVQAASWAGAVPLSFGASRRGTRIEGYAPSRGEDMEFHFYTAGPGYFETMRIPLVAGRGFTEADRRGAPPVMVVNETFARRFWPGQNPIGKRVSTRGEAGPFMEVIGVARDGRYRSLASDPLPHMFFPALQEPGGTVLHVRVNGDPLSLVPAIQTALAEVAPTWTLDNPQTLEDHVAASVLPQRIARIVLSVFAAAALFLVGVGLYGVVAYSVASRTWEIGVRIALGAEPRTTRWMVVRQGVVLVVAGVVIALPLAWAVMRLLEGFLVGSTANDPVAFAIVVLMFGIITLVATYVPARRASQVDPMVALRAE